MDALAIGLAGLFIVLAAAHFYWAAGGGSDLDGFVPTDGGRPVLTPGPLASAAVGVALLAAALVVACRAGLLCAGLPAWVARIGIWVLAAVFAARAIGEFRYVGFFKRVRDSRFARRDTRLFSPLCAAIAVAAALVGLG
jgi:hypothetical protein